MARAFSTSVLAPLVMSRAVSFTIPSVGSSLVERRKYSASAASIFCGWPGAVRSTTTLRVAIRLVTVSAGVAPEGNSANTMPKPSGPVLPSTIFAERPAALNVLERVFWNGSGRSRAVGTQMRVTPAGCKTSTRVVTSKVRQSAIAAVGSDFPAFGRARAAAAMLAERRKSRRFMGSPGGAKFLLRSLEQVLKVARFGGKNKSVATEAQQPKKSHRQER